MFRLSQLSRSPLFRDPAVPRPTRIFLSAPRLRRFAGLAALLTGAAPALAAGGVTGTLPRDPEACPLVLLAENGMPVPGGGTLDTRFLWSASVNDRGEIAFTAAIDGDPQDEGLFIARRTGLQVIARGCGGAGGTGLGCGDPTPAGGTYTGFFGGSVVPPVLNNRGDVLFGAEVLNGSENYGYFLYRAATDDVVKVAVSGDPSPRGGVLEAFSPASLNDRGEIIFGVWDADPNEEFGEIYLVRWSGGTLETLLEPGDFTTDGAQILAMGGGIFGFLNGLQAPIDPAPFLTDSGEALVGVILNSGRALVSVGSEGTRVIVRDGDAAPGGGTFFEIRSGAVRDGRYVFSSGDVSGVFSGTPGQWQTVWAAGQTVDGEDVAVFPSIQGFRPNIDDFGQVTALFRVETSSSPFEDRVVRWNEEKGRFILVSFGDAAPGGGTFLSFSFLISVSSRGDTVLPAFVQRPTGAFGEYYLLENCAADRIFVDEFEDGTLNAWSLVVP